MDRGEGLYSLQQIFLTVIGEDIAGKVSSGIKESEESVSSWKYGWCVLVYLG